jgi:hypothetical protein
MPSAASSAAPPRAPPPAATAEPPADQADRHRTAAHASGGLASAGAASSTECCLELTASTSPLTKAASSSSIHGGRAASDGIGNECIICFSSLDETATDAGEMCERLSCGHLFHARCIGEWLEKDGRCPVCRHVINHDVAHRSAEASRLQQQHPPISMLFNGEVIWPPPDFVVGSEATTELILGESRRLMLLSSIESTLSILYLTVTQNMLSPLCMLLASVGTFHAACHFSARHMSYARPMLSANVLYHLYTLYTSVGPVNDLNDVNDVNNVNVDVNGVPTDGFLARPAPRAPVLAVTFVIVVELLMLKKAGFFHMALLSCGSDERQR